MPLLKLVLVSSYQIVRSCNCMLLRSFHSKAIRFFPNRIDIYYFAVVFEIVFDIHMMASHTEIKKIDFATVLSSCTT